MTVAPVKVPGALLPVAMSLAALALVLGHAAIFGVTREADDGASARVFQLLLAAQLPFVLVFAVNWLPRLPHQAWRVHAVRASAGLIAVAAAYWLA